MQSLSPSFPFLFWLFIALFRCFFGSSETFTLSRKDGSTIQGYLSCPFESTSFPLVILCQGSDIGSVYRLQERFEKEFNALNMALVSIEKGGIFSETDIRKAEFLQYDNLYRRVDDHKLLYRHLQEHPIPGWDGRIMIMGGSEGGVVATILATWPSISAAFIFASGIDTFRNQMQGALPLLMKQSMQREGIGEEEMAKTISEEMKNINALFDDAIEHPDARELFSGHSAKWLASILDRNVLDDFLLISCPILYMHGKEDISAPIEETEKELVATFTKLGRTNLEYHALENCGHLLPDDKLSYGITWLANRAETWKSKEPLLQNKQYFPTPYTFELDEQFHQLVGSSPPYAALFSNENKEVIYLAVTHSNDIQSKTFRWIETAIHHFKPDLILIEGVKSNLGYSLRTLVDRVRNADLSDWQWGEPSYVVYLANQHGIPFLGGEVDDEIIAEQLKQEGYTTNDIIYHRFSRLIPELYRKGTIHTLNDIEREWYLFKKRYVQQPSHTSYEQYGKWIRRHLHPFNFDTLIQSNNSAPVEGGNFLQKMSSKIGVMRNKHLLNTIYSHAKRTDKLLVVYGASHLSQQYQALKQLFGSPSFFIQPNDYSHDNTKK